MRIRPFTQEWFETKTRRDPETGCILYTGFTDPLGYARVWWRGKGGVLVHRVAYEVAVGAFDQSLKVCHRCDVPNCLNPDHLFLGTHKDNMRDMFAKGRAKPQGQREGERAKQILALVAENPDLTINQIARKLGIHTETARSHAKRNGIRVRRAPANPTRQRSLSRTPVPQGTESEVAQRGVTGWYNTSSTKLPAHGPADIRWTRVIGLPCPPGETSKHPAERRDAGTAS